MPTLLEEIQAKCSPELLATRDCVAIAAKVNETRKRAAPVPRAIFARWCAKSGLRATIEDHANTAQSPLRSIALTLLDFLRGTADTLDLSDPDNAAMLAAWVQAKALTEAQRDELLALAQVPDPIDEITVRRACWSDDGQWLAGGA